MAVENRRATPRIVTALKVESLSGGPMMVAHDIGVGGMMVTTAVPRWPGTLIPVRFRLPKQPRAIRTTCRVVAMRPEEHGLGLSLQFLRLAQEAQQAIARYVEASALPDYDDLPVATRVNAWVERIAEDCEQIKILAQG